MTHLAGVSAQHRDLVPEHQQLSILRPVAAEHQDGQPMMQADGKGIALRPEHRNGNGGHGQAVDGILGTHTCTPRPDRPSFPAADPCAVAAAPLATSTASLGLRTAQAG